MVQIYQERVTLNTSHSLRQTGPGNNCLKSWHELLLLFEAKQSVARSSFLSRPRQQGSARESYTQCGVRGLSEILLRFTVVENRGQHFLNASPTR
jgi:hypothetical protein